MFLAGEYDVIVVGAGHGGCEAALVTARLGCKTLIATSNLDSIGFMPCNPSLGGPAKGHLVREIDALGGQMAIQADRSSIQMRLLNTGKGPAVHALRSQSDKAHYHLGMKDTLENEPNLTVKQVMVTEILTEDGKVSGILCETGENLKAPVVILATGTYLRSKIIIGETVIESGPNGFRGSEKLSESLEKLGLTLFRFKTGTPARVDERTVDYSRMVIQPGDEEPRRFSHLPDDFSPLGQKPCYLTHSNLKTHEIIQKNMHRSPLYSGIIEGTGTRYCPSIEDKVVRFADKESHPIFIEPEGLTTRELYIQGVSSSLPVEVYQEFIRTVPGLEEVEIMRPAYAIEYDVIDPLQLNASLMVKSIPGLFAAGQVNGTSGYEEAAAQGLMAGINSARYLQGQEPFILERSDGYIGVLVDDLVTKGTREPYRMMTSRAEYRLTLRNDNCDLRLTRKGRDIGLVNDFRWNLFLEKEKTLKETLEWIQKEKIQVSDEINAYLTSRGTSAIKETTAWRELIKRPELSYQELIPYGLLDVPSLIAEQVEISVRYEGYISKQAAQVERVRKLEEKKLAADFDYLAIRGLSTEARQKLDQIRPRSVGQASRISGVSPADIGVLLVALEGKRRGEKGDSE